MSSIRLCSLSALPSGESREFELEGGLSGFVVYRDDMVFAYRNSCPHTGAPLNWMPDRFIDRSGRYIQCDTHGALFRIEDGVCVAGPCAGERLSSIKVRIEEESVVLDEDYRQQ